MEVVVQRCEEHYHQTYDQGGLDQRECQAEEFVEPAEHHDGQDFLQESSYKTEGDEHSDHYDGEGYYRQDVFGGFDILPYPLSYDRSELVRHPYAGDDRYDRYCLTYKTFPHSADYSRYEAN